MSSFTQNALLATTMRGSLSPAHSDQESSLVDRLGMIYVLCVPFAAGVSTARGLTVAGFNYTGWIWVLFVVCGSLLVTYEMLRRKECRIYFAPFCPWAIFLMFLWLSLSWTDKIGLRNIQDAIQISMPVLVGIVATVYIRSESQLRTLFVVFLIALVPLFISAFFSHHRVPKGLDMRQARRAVALTGVLFGCVMTSRLGQRIKSARIGYLACVVLTFVSGGRMATAVLLLLPIISPASRGKSIYVRSIIRVVVLVMLVSIAIALFYTPFFQERFFYSGSGTLSDLYEGNFNTAGRLEAWPYILEEALKHPILGAGIGTTYEFVPTVWAEIRHCHNDYLRIGFELGLVGLSIFLAVVVWQLVDLKRRIAKSDGITRSMFVAAYLGMFGFLVTAMTDNTLIYNTWYMNPLMALIGAAYGVHRHQDV